MIYSKLLAKYPLISDQVDRSELAVILRELEKNVLSGDVRSVVEFDSFRGLPKKTTVDMSVVDDQFQIGEPAASKNDFIMSFKKQLSKF